MSESYNEHDEKSIDFAHAGLYIPALQTVFATTTAACVSVLAAWLIPASMISAVRTLALTISVAFIIVRRPVRIGPTKGVFTIFSALRPCPFIYVTVLVLEQLVHACINEEATFDHSLWRQVLYHSCVLTMIVAGFMRSRSPRAESDVPFAVSLAAFLCVSIFPPPAMALSGPLCAPPELFAAGERVLRAFLFSCVYTVLVYASAPISNSLADTLVCIARSTAASGWVLGSILYSLPLALLQVVLVLYCSFSPVQTQYHGVSPGGVADLENSVVPEDVESSIASPINSVSTMRGVSPSSEHERSANGGVASYRMDEANDPDVLHGVAVLKAQQRSSFQPIDSREPRPSQGFFNING